MIRRVATSRGVRFPLVLPFVAGELERSGPSASIRQPCAGKMRHGAGGWARRRCCGWCARRSGRGRVATALGGHDGGQRGVERPWLTPQPITDRRDHHKSFSLSARCCLRRFRKRYALFPLARPSSLLSSRACLPQAGPARGISLRFPLGDLEAPTSDAQQGSVFRTPQKIAGDVHPIAFLARHHRRFAS